MFRCIVLGIMWVIIVIGFTHFLYHGLGVMP